MEEIRPRYEFRIRRESLATTQERLERLAPPKKTASQETYLISALTDKCNAKIRAALIDVKVLVNESQGLEQWKPILKEGFPLERSVIATQVFPNLGLSPPALGRSIYTLSEFLGDVVRAEPRITIVDVSKTRYQYGIRECAAEFAQITLDGLSRETVAVESVDPEAVLQLIRELSISGANTSYIREIKRLLGLRAVRGRGILNRDRFGQPHGERDRAQIPGSRG